MGRTLCAVPLLCLMVFVLSLTCLPSIPAAYAQDDWKTEFETICAKTEDPMRLDRAELRSLIERCDRLRSSIEKLDETTAKVYLRRLQMCRNLFEYVLNSKPSP